jgi:GNAT superfamily N-acetyltransferase
VVRPRIDYLADHPAVIPTLARWHHRQFQHLSPGSSVERCTSHLRSHTGRRQIPTTVVALADDEPLGSASLVAQDMDVRPHLSPWLATVYVAPEYRGRGIGSALVRRIAEEAASLGVPRLHLYAQDQMGFYERLGWQAVERLKYRGYLVTVMALDLVSDQADETRDCPSGSS